MRERLIEVIGNKPFTSEYENYNSVEWAEHFADYLLTNGVIVPPCKVGDTVYCIRYDKARKPFVKPLGVLSITAYGKGKFTVFTTKEDLWCVTAFPTREEAEKTLKEAEG